MANFRSLGVTQLLLGPLVLCTACASADDGENFSDDNITSSKATLDRTIDSPIPEVSGLALRKSSSSGMELLAVGDRDATLALGSTSGSSLGKLSPAATGTPQWESIASDASRNIFVLGETSGRLTVFDPTGKSVRHTMTIQLPSSWSSGNAGAESFVLLKNGHLLIVKEKDPVTIAEVGPAGEAAKGFTKGMGVRPKDTFPLPGGATSTRVILKTWKLGDKTGQVATDVSDATIAPDGTLYLLTDQGRAILKMQDSISTEESKVKAVSTWELPKDIKKPEGLVFQDDGTAIVGSDMPEAGKQIFVLKALP